MPKDSATRSLTRNFSFTVLYNRVTSKITSIFYTTRVKFRFVGELFNANVLSAHTLLEFLQIIPNKLTNRGLENTCCLLKAAGKKLEQVISFDNAIFYDIIANNKI